MRVLSLVRGIHGARLHSGPCPPRITRRNHGLRQPVLVLLLVQQRQAGPHQGTRRAERSPRSSLQSAHRRLARSLPLEPRRNQSCRSIARGASHDRSTSPESSRPCPCQKSMGPTRPASAGIVISTAESSRPRPNIDEQRPSKPSATSSTCGNSTTSSSKTEPSHWTCWSESWTSGWLESSWKQNWLGSQSIPVVGGGTRYEAATGV